MLNNPPDLFLRHLMNQGVLGVVTTGSGPLQGVQPRSPTRLASLNWF